MSENPFVKAGRHQSRAKIALAGPSGSGKTYSALLIAKGMGGKVAVIDTERGSASLYSHLMDFDVLELFPPYRPEKFIDAIGEAIKAKYETLIIDSITHEWNGSGGILDLVDLAVKGSRSGNSFTAWNEITPRHRAFVDCILQCPAHVIATLRTKAAYILEEKGDKKVPRKVGMAPEQRDGIEYEFTTVLDISVDSHIAMPSKDRTGLFTDPGRITEETGAVIRDWLASATQTGMTESAQADHQAAIESATTIEDLNTALTAAYAAAKEAGNDKRSADRFRTLSLVRRNQITAPKKDK